MGIADLASCTSPQLVRYGRTQVRICLKVGHALRLVGMLCISVILMACSVHAATARHMSPIQHGRHMARSAAEPFTVDNENYALDPLTLSLVRRIYAAATHADYVRLGQLLRRYCTGSASIQDAQIKLWHRPGVLHEMAAILLTHGAGTDGYTYPGFAIAGFQTSYDYEDAIRLHVKAPRIPTYTFAYKGPTIIISWPFATHSAPHWCGIENYRQ